MDLNIKTECPIIYLMLHIPDKISGICNIRSCYMIFPGYHSESEYAFLSDMRRIYWIFGISLRKLFRQLDDITTGEVAYIVGKMTVPLFETGFVFIAGGFDAPARKHMRHSSVIAHRVAIQNKRYTRPVVDKRNGNVTELNVRQNDFRAFLSAAAFYLIIIPNKEETTKRAG